MPTYKHGKQMAPIDLKILSSYMNEGHFSGGDYHRSFLAFLYWFGVRRMEALLRKREDFVIEETVMFVEVPPIKRGQPRPPLEIDTDLPFVDLIINQVLETPFGERVWPFSDTTAWRIVKRVDETKYPHFFRLNRCSQMLDDPGATTPEIRTWFGWRTSRTIDSYIGISRRYVRAGRARLRRELEHGVPSS